MLLGILGCSLDVVYLSVMSQVETGQEHEGGDILANVACWIPTSFKLPIFSHTSEHHQLEVPSMPATSEQAFELPKLGAAEGPSTLAGTFQTFLSSMVGVNMINVMMFLHFIHSRHRINTEDWHWKATQVTQRRNIYFMI